MHRECDSIQTVSLTVLIITWSEDVGHVCVYIYTGWPFENETEPILGTSKHLRQYPRTRQFLIKGGTIFLLISPT